MSYCEAVFTAVDAGKQTPSAAAAASSSPCRASLDTGVVKIEDSERIYNIEFKIWGVKKKKT